MRKSTIGALAAAGLFLTCIGLAAVFMQRPENPAPFHTGNEVAYWFGLAMSAIGGTMLCIAVIAYSVSLGVRAARHQSDTE